MEFIILSQGGIVKYFLVVSADNFGAERIQNELDISSVAGHLKC